MAKGGQSAVRSVYDDPEVNRLPYIPTALYLKTRGRDVLGVRKPGAPNGWGVPQRYLDAVNPATGTTAVTLVPKPTFPEQEELVEASVLAISSTISGEKSAKQALDDAAATFASVLGDKAK